MADGAAPPGETAVEGILGQGYHATAAAKLVVGVLHSNLKEFMLKRVGILAPGPNWDTEIRRVAEGNPLRVLVSKLLGINPSTVKRYVQEYAQSGGNDLAEPLPRGRRPLTKEEYRAKYQSLYDLICAKILDARNKGNTLNVNQLAVYLSEETGQPDFSHPQLRHFLLRLGFSYGRVQRYLKNGRTKPYVIAWVKQYAQRRVDALAAAAAGEASAFEYVDAFTDETHLFQDETGNYSWYLDEKSWGSGRLSRNKWGMVHVLFAWWEENPEDPGGAHVRRFGVYEHTVSTWQCKGSADEDDPPLFADFSGEMNGERYEAWFEECCRWAREEKFPSRKLRWHIDNASIHKRGNGARLDLDDPGLEPIAVVNWLVQNSDPESGLGDFDSYIDDEGNFPSIETLRELVNSHAAAEPYKLNAIAAAHGHEKVEFTPPYWPQFQPCELMWNNMKGDYRSWDCAYKVRDVGQSMRRFVAEVCESECRGWVQHTDKFCRAVVGRDAGVLDALVMELL